MCGEPQLKSVKIYDRQQTVCGLNHLGLDRWLQIDISTQLAR